MKKNSKLTPRSVVISHSYADFDAIASMIAATKIYPDACPVINNSTEKEVQRFLTIYKDYFGFNFLQDISLEKMDHLIVVDFQDFSRIKPIQEELKKREIKVEIFDHHPLENCHSLKQKKIKPYGSSTTIFYEILKRKKIAIQPIEATLFLIGIYEDTGALTFSSTTVKDIEAAAFFLKNGAKLNVISEFVFPPIDDTQKHLFSQLFNTVQKFDFKGITVAISAVDSKKYVNGVSFLVHRIMETIEVDCLFVIVRFKEKVLIIGRSRDVNTLHIGKVLELFGGGGHPQAGSAFLDSHTPELNLIVLQLLGQIKKNIKISRLVNDFMTSPVKVVSPGISAEETLKIMLRYGHSGLPVVENGKIIGIISRSDIARINEESLIQRPVSAYMSRNPILISPETSMREAERLMVEKEIGRLPVVFENKIVGIITRTDLLRALYGIQKISSKRSKSRSEFPNQAEIIFLLRKSIPEPILEKIHRIGKAADELNYKIYLVGGSVRDLLLEEKPNDFDFLIEGSAILLSEKLKEEKGFFVVQNRKFQTAKIQIDSNLHFDLASARTEYYEHPADLPTVSKGSLREDLFRRDFTINTLAICLNKQDFGSLINCYQGYEDLKNKKIKILHNLSFIEDPSRIFRAISYALKFKFTLDQGTKVAAINAMKSGIFHRTSKFRILSELISMLNEIFPVTKAIKMLEDLHATALLSENIRINQEILSHIDCLDQNLSELPIHDKWLLYFIALTLQINDTEVLEISDRLKLNQKKINFILHFRNNYKNTLKELESTKKNSEIWSLLNLYSEEELLILSSISKSENTKSKIIKFYRELRFIKPNHDGSEIKKKSGLEKKFLGKLIHQLTMLKIDSMLPTDEEEEKQIKVIAERIKNEIKMEHQN